LLKIHVIPDPTLLLEVPTTSTALPTASLALLLEVPTTSTMSTVPGPTVTVGSNVEVAEAASIHHLEVPMASTALTLSVPRISTT
jgi:hypothetical protein